MFCDRSALQHEYTFVIVIVREVGINEERFCGAENQPFDNLLVLACNRIHYAAISEFRNRRNPNDGRSVVRVNI